MLPEAASASDDSPWRQQRDASGRLAQEMLNFARQNFARDLDAAWLDFNQDDAPLPIEEDPEEGQIFVPYFLFDWDPEPRPRRRPPVAGLIARSYLSKKGSRLPELERLILEQALTQPLTFYEVVRCNPGEGMVVRDVLLGAEMDVIERTASRMLRPGDLGYGQICELPEVTTLGRLAPLCIPPSHKAAIVGLRTKLQKEDRQAESGADGTRPDPLSGGYSHHLSEYPGLHTDAAATDQHRRGPVRLAHSDLSHRVCACRL